MTKSPGADPRLGQFPAVLRQLLDAEIAAGNTIVEVSASFPAPPAGACAKLAKPITTRSRVKTPELDFYDRNTSLYSGEWTDAKRFYFVIEPPHPPAPEPDMDAIRAASNQPRQVNRAATAAAGEKGGSLPDAGTSAPVSRVERFRASMRIDYEKWHDGIGYDLDQLKSATPEELKTIEGILVSREVSDWRDVEALAAMNTPASKRALKRALLRAKVEIRGAIIRHAPTLVSEDDKVAFLIAALKTAEFYGGLSQALDQIAVFHPPAIVDELLRGSLERKGEAAVHFAALLMFIHGKAKEPFDWDHRPFFLRFNAATRAERETAFRELCDKIGINAGAYLR